MSTGERLWTALVERLGTDVAVQGNLDPLLLFAPASAAERRVARRARARVASAGHVFNLGHGILPETPVDQVKHVVDFVHEHGRK